jgi:hypothetical protein
MLEPSIDMSDQWDWWRYSIRHFTSFTSVDIPDVVLRLCKKPRPDRADLVRVRVHSILNWFWSDPGSVRVRVWRSFRAFSTRVLTDDLLYSVAINFNKCSHWIGTILTSILHWKSRFSPIIFNFLCVSRSIPHNMTLSLRTFWTRQRGIRLERKSGNDEGCSS